MRKFLRYISLIAIAFALTSSLQSNAFAQSGEWLSVKKLNRYIKKAKREGLMPTNIQCRDRLATKVAFKPEIRVSWRKNSTDKAWRIMAYKGQMDWQPSRSGNKKWRRIKRSDFQIGSGGTMYRCSLFHAQ